MSRNCSNCYSSDMLLVHDNVEIITILRVVDGCLLNSCLKVWSYKFIPHVLNGGLNEWNLNPGRMGELLKRRSHQRSKEVTQVSDKLLNALLPMRV
jgi:hypothetical protein